PDGRRVGIFTADEGVGSVPGTRQFGMGRYPGGQSIVVIVVVADDQRVAVVAAALNEVDFVVGKRAVLGFVQMPGATHHGIGQALRVAVAVAPHRRLAAGGAKRGVVGKPLVAEAGIGIGL